MTMIEKVLPRMLMRYKFMYRIHTYNNRSLLHAFHLFKLEFLNYLP